MDTDLERRGRYTLLVVVALFAVIACVGTSASALGKQSADLDARTSNVLANLPVTFERNDGQVGGGHDFIAHGAGYEFLLQASGTEMHLARRGGNALVGMTLIGARADATPTAAHPLPGRSNYYRGKDLANWRTGVPSFERVRYSGVYDGIDVEYYGRGGQLEYDFVVAPGADPSRINMVFDGIDDLCVDADGTLILGTAAGEVRHAIPSVYERSEAGTLREVKARFTLRGDRVGFDVGSWDHSSELIIDPSVIYKVNFPYEALGMGGLAVDSSGNFIVAGATYYTIPLVNALSSTLAHGANKNWSAEAFVMKIAPNGSMVYSTYLGGDGYDVVSGVAVDPAGNAYVAGITGSYDFPVSANAFQKANTAFQFPDADGMSLDAFVTKLAADGSLSYSTYLGGMHEDKAEAVAVDAAGNAYVVGETSSGDFPATVDMRPASSDSSEKAFAAFVTKLDANGSAVIYSTIIGDLTPWTVAWALAVDETGAAYIGGTTNSTVFPTTRGAFQENSGYRDWPGASDGFVAKLAPSGVVDRLTLIGGAGDDTIRGIAVDATHDVYVVGKTLSTDLPVTPSAIQKTNQGRTDGFYARFDPTLSTAKYLTYIGGSGSDDTTGIAVDGSGNVTIAGVQSAGMPLLNPLPWGIRGALLSFDSTNSLRFATSIGGFEAGIVALDSSGAICVVDDYYLSLMKLSASGSQQFMVGSFNPEGRSDQPSAGATVGAGFGAFPSGTQFTVGGQPLTGVTFSSGMNAAYGTLPDLPPGVYDVVATYGEQSATLTRGFEKVAGQFAINSVAPARTGSSAGTILTIKGTGFPPHAAASFGSIPAGDLFPGSWRVDGTTMMATVRGLRPGVYDVNVLTRAFGSQEEEHDVTLTSGLTISEPSVDGANPSYGSSAGGTTVRIEGADMGSSTQTVTIGGTPAILASTGAQVTTVTTPPHVAGRVDLAVSGSSGSTTIPGGFLYVQAISVASVSPSHGPAAGGINVTITGSGFLSGARVDFGGVAAANVVVVSETSITCTTPPHVPGRVRIYVRNTDGGAAELTTAFVYDGPRIDSITTVVGLATGGTSLTISGGGFDENPKVFLGGVEATVTQVTVPTSIRVTTPPHAPGTVDLIVQNSDGVTGTQFHAFTFLGETLVVSGIAPDHGPIVGGASVTISGAGFTSSDAVTIDGLRLIDAVITSTSISGKTPAGSGGSKTVRVYSLADGQSATTSYKYDFPPTISGISPGSGPTDGGTSVTISGFNFASGAAVTFGGTLAASVTVTNSSTMTVITPAHPAGDADVTVTVYDQSVTKTNGFRFVPPPPSVTATAGSETAIDVVWTGGAQQTTVQRSTTKNGVYQDIATVTSTSFRDSGVEAGRTYFYRLLRTAFSQYSTNVDYATTVAFSDDPIIAGATVVKAAHLTELRTAVNAMRTAANLPTVTWTDPADASTTIRAVHMSELRNALASALASFGTSITFSTLAAGDTIRAIHFQELRDAVK